ncbi:MAG: DUF4347 domain-containing protein, partial [Flavobacteriaceae bacterium]
MTKLFSIHLMAIVLTSVTVTAQHSNSTFSSGIHPSSDCLKSTHNTDDGRNALFVDKTIKDHSLIMEAWNHVNSVGNEIHLFSHGRKGELFINDKWRNPKEIATFLDKEFNIAASGPENIYIYGCNFAKGEKGLEAIQYLESQLNVSITASTNMTGRKGDWELEIGNSTNKIAIPNYNYTLQNIGGTVNSYASVTGISGTTFTVDDATGFTAGDLVMIIQMQGAVISTDDDEDYGTVLDTNGAGNYELLNIASVSSNDISFASVANSYDVNNTIQIIKVPDYSANALTTVTSEITGLAFDGAKGGVVAIKADVLQLDANINMSNAGFRGGAINLTDGSIPGYVGSSGAQKGEGIAKFAAEDRKRGKQANGGGAGNWINAGGAGGGNFGIGGRGGEYNGSTTIQSGGVGGDAFGGCGNGLGGQPPTVIRHPIMGGGGGAGDSNDAGVSIGGIGGGIIFVFANEVNGNGGSIVANGENGDASSAGDGSAGGGAGGTFYTTASTFSGSLNVTLKGGNGGNATSNHSAGGGGGGGALFLGASTIPSAITLDATGGSHGTGSTSPTPQDGFSGGLVNVNQVLPPEIENNQTFSLVVGNITNGDVLNGVSDPGNGIVDATVSAGSTLANWAIVGPSGASSIFQINASTGELSVADASTLTIPEDYTVYVQVENTTGEISCVVGITVAVDCEFGSINSVQHATSASPNANASWGSVDGAAGAPDITSSATDVVANRTSIYNTTATVLTYNDTFSGGAEITIHARKWSSGYARGMTIAFSEDNVTYTAESTEMTPSAETAGQYDALTYSIPNTVGNDYQYIRLSPAGGGSSLLLIDAVSVSKNECFNCPTGIDAPALSSTSISNVCPVKTFDLTSITASNGLANTTLTWHTGTPATNANSIVDPTAVTHGIYYAAFYNAANDCYSGENGEGTTMVITEGDTDCDGILDITDIDDDNDGILDTDECSPTSFLELSSIDGSFESLTDVASSSGANSNPLATGWAHASASADSWINTDNTGSGWSAGANNGLPNSPDGGVYISGSASYSGGESIVTNSLTGITIGEDYVITLYQAYGGVVGSDIIGNQARFKVTLNGESQYTPTMTWNGAGANSWEQVILVFTNVQSSTPSLEIRPEPVSLNSSFANGYISFDGIQMLSQDAYNNPSTYCDEDGDNIPNVLDLDSDGDGCSDSVEAGNTTVANNDISNYNTGADTNNNGLLDQFEDGTTGNINYTSTYETYALADYFNLCADTDGDTVSDLVDIDDDNDGILDADEAPSCYYSAAEIENGLTPSGSDFTWNASYPISNAVDASSATFSQLNPLNQSMVDMTIVEYTIPVSAKVSNVTILATYMSTNASSTFKLQGWDGTQWVDLSTAISNTGTNATTNFITLTNTLATNTSVTKVRLQGVAGNINYGRIYDTQLTLGAFQASLHPKPQSCAVDTDSDGTTNSLDLDSDGDGCSDSVEAGNTPVSSNNIATYNSGADTNTNGLLDAFENGTTGTINYTSTYYYATLAIWNACADTDGDGVGDAADIDNDNDGILDIVENANAFNVMDATFESAYAIGTEETHPNGVSFNIVGTKMYVIGQNGDEVNQYSLDTPFDLTGTVSFDGLFSVASEEATPESVIISNDGTTLLVLGSTGDDINQYALSTPFDVTAGVTLTGTFSIATEETAPTGLLFNTSGTKMYVIGQTGDDINQYSLTTPFDVTAGVTL